MPPAGLVIAGVTVLSQFALVGIGVSLATTIISGVLQISFVQRPRRVPL